ncbi:MAG: PAS domain S-box protein [Bacteroidetes bacterium]|nr:PAS domain S-box protein [Bacteroidota bacterium]
MAVESGLEKLLKKNSNLNELILNKIGTIAMVADKNANIVYVSPSITKILGYTPQEISGQNWWLLAHSDSVKREEYITSVKNCITGSAPLNKTVHTNPVRDKNGTIKWIQWQDSLIPGEYLIGIGQEVTDNIFQQEIIKIQNKQLELLSQVASKTDNIVLILDGIGDILWVSPSFENLHHLSYEKFTETFGKSIFQASNFPDIRNLFTKCITTKKTVNYQSLNKKVKGQEVWELSTMTPVVDQNGKIKYVTIIDSDISARKKLELEKNSKHKDLLDALKYAKHIQSFLLPEFEHLKNDFSDVFLYSQPKNIVSGDFYWFKKYGNEYFFMVGDCTGHGVPAAMLSMVTITLMNRICKQNKDLPINQIVKEFYSNFNHLFNSKVKDNVLNDTVDLAFFKINFETDELHFYGINRPLYLVANNELVPFKGYRMPIYNANADVFARPPLIYSLKKGDLIYAFSDGFYDQFGGVYDKKFLIKKFKHELVSLTQTPFTDHQKYLENKFNSWKGKSEQTDDVLVFALNY